MPAQLSSETLKAFETVPNMYLLLDPALRIITASDLMLDSLSTTRQAIIGKYLFEAFPPADNSPENNGAHFIEMSLKRVLETKKPDQVKTIRYDIPDESNPGNFIQRYWLPSHTPVLDANGEISYIIQLGYNVTEEVLAKEALIRSETKQEELATTNEELAAANEELVTTNDELIESREQLKATMEALSISESQTRSIVEGAPFPIGVYTGREMRISFANQSIKDVWGKGNDVVGKLYAEVLPELQGTEIYSQLAAVFETGVPLHMRNQKLMLVVDGVPTVFYFNYSFTVLKNDDGEIYGVMNTAADVTDAAIAKEQVEEAAEEMATLNEELTAANEEISASNEELAAINTELNLYNDKQNAANKQLEKLNLDLKRSRDETQLAISAASLATFDLNPITGKFMGNDLLKEWFGLKPEEEIPLSKATDVIDPADRDHVLAAINHALTFNSGGNYEAFYTIINPLTQVSRTVMAKGKTLFNDQQEPIKLSGVLQDITEPIVNLKRVEQAEESLRMAVEAAELASYYINIVDRVFVPSPRLKELLGFGPDEEVPYEAAIGQIHPEYRQAAADLVEAAITKGVKFDMEYPILARGDGKMRWLRGIGTVQQDANGNNKFFTGVVNDITEKRADEQRKNDFIGMVSHELKTPLTSMKGYIQILQAKASKNNDSFTDSLLGKAGRQITKMTTMINGFLNVSRLESGKIHIDKQLFDMAVLVKEAEEEVIATITSHKVVFAPVEPTMVFADRDKIGQVINNFISNAVKYSELNSTINVACITINNNALINVKDNGIGVSQQDAGKLFERYYRTENVKAGSISGFGIGLYLCSEIIERHDGKIGVESELGQGSNFWFTLPIAG